MNQRCILSEQAQKCVGGHLKLRFSVYSCTRFDTLHKEKMPNKKDKAWCQTYSVAWYFCIILNYMFDSIGTGLSRDLPFYSPPVHSFSSPHMQTTHALPHKIQFAETKQLNVLALLLACL